MPTYTLRDGTVIEWAMSDTYAGPDGEPGCQRTSRNGTWWRTPGREWVLTSHRSTHRLLSALQESDTLAQFLATEE